MDINLTEEDVKSACLMLGKDPKSILGNDPQYPRRAVALSSASVDVAACPGSGKTTLLVVKLAMLGNSWPHGHKGMCVLSHTNIAGKEIEERLGGTELGARLLKYPHFVGTIHQFTDRYLALPWFRSRRKKVDLLNNHYALRWRFHQLEPDMQKNILALQGGIEMLQYTDSTFSPRQLAIYEKPQKGSKKWYYEKVKDVCEASYDQGIFCFDEMLVWAHHAISEVKKLPNILRSRFPVLFVDEAQDNSVLQSQLIHDIFMKGADSVIRQRFGDDDQAIFGYGEDSQSQVDPFPNRDIIHDLKDSFRFGSDIAALAQPLSVSSNDLIGKGPVHARNIQTLTGRHTIFKFDDRTITHVIPAFGTHLTRCFTGVELQSEVFAAVGYRHRGSQPKIPYSIRDYWQEYVVDDAFVGAATPGLLDFVADGCEKSAVTGRVGEAVNTFAHGMFHLLQIADPQLRVNIGAKSHQRLAMTLDGQAEIWTEYCVLCREVLALPQLIDDILWSARFRKVAREVVELIAGSTTMSRQVINFIERDCERSIGNTEPSEEGQGNIFEKEIEGHKVRIQVGTIHSVKGQTHAATLVLDTHWKNSYNLKMLMDWLCGSKRGGDGENPTICARLRAHYVGMTRPARLLCLAIHKRELDEGKEETLRNHGWQIRDVANV